MIKTNLHIGIAYVGSTDAISVYNYFAVSGYALMPYLWRMKYTEEYYQKLILENSFKIKAYVEYLLNR